MVLLSHQHTTTGKTIALTRWTLVSKVMSLLFNTLSRLVITFLPRSKCLLISWLQSPSAVILQPKKIVSHCFHLFSICHEKMRLDAMILVFWMLSFKPTFSFSSFIFIKTFFCSSMKWQPTPVLLPWKSHGQRSLGQATIHGVAKSRAQLSDFTFTYAA